MAFPPRSLLNCKIVGSREGAHCCHCFSSAEPFRGVCEVYFHLRPSDGCGLGLLVTNFLLALLIVTFIGSNLDFGVGRLPLSEIPARPVALGYFQVALPKDVDTVLGVVSTDFILNSK